MHCDVLLVVGSIGVVGLTPSIDERRRLGFAHGSVRGLLWYYISIRNVACPPLMVFFLNLALSRRASLVLLSPEAPKDEESNCRKNYYATDGSCYDRNI